MTLAQAPELARYLASVSLRAARTDSGQTVAGRRELRGSCLWLDVSGFTALSERLAQQGAAGIAAISATLNQFYDGITGVVAASAGDVVFFAGDGALCYWNASGESELAHSAFAAAEAALRLQSEVGACRHGGELLEFRIGIGSGVFYLDTTGGDRGSWFDILTGPALAAVALLGSSAPAGRILVAPECAALLGSQVRLEPCGPETFMLRGISGALDSSPRSDDRQQGLTTAKLSERAPAFVVQQLEADQPPVAELRRVSVAFCTWDREVSRDFEAVQRLALTLQRLVTEHDATLCQLVEDDKGVQGLVVFGLPGKSRGEDARRAVRFASQVVEQLCDATVRPRVGVATGSAFCGVCGGDRRRQYCVIGQSVIRAARLAPFAMAAPLVDEATYEQGRRRYSFAAAQALRLKGLGRSVSAYQVGAPRKDLVGPERLIGRAQEWTAVEASLRAFAEGRGNALTAIEGELGVGKTALLSRVPALCRELGLEMALGIADEVEQHSSFFTLKQVLQTLLDDPGSQLEVLQELGEGDLAALLNPLLGVSFPESALSASMAPETRAENRRRLVATLLQRQLNGRSCVAIIDDVHWLDSSSSELIRYLSERVRLHWLLAGRPLAGTSEAPAGRSGPINPIKLAPLGGSEVAELVAFALGSQSVAATLSARINDLASGNPLHSIELTRALAASGCIEATNGELCLAERAQRDLAQVSGTLEELIQSRFDRLPSETRAVLRAASVLGTSFDLSLLFELLESTMSSVDVELALEPATAEGIVRLRAGHEFQHASIQAVVYGLLLPSEQSKLHERAALALQRMFRGSEHVIAARLAHHWLRAGVAASAAEYAGLAASQSLESYANAEAVRFYTQALEQDQSHRGDLRLDAKRANWASGLGQALYSQSRHRDSRAAYRRAIKWSAPSLPLSGTSLLLSIARYLIEVVLAERLGVRGRQAPPEVRVLCLAGLRATSACGALDVWEGRLIEAVNRSFAARRLARRVQGTSEAAEVIAGFGYLLGATPARRRGERELGTAVDMADAIGDLQGRVSTRVFRGMFLTMVGRTKEAEEPLLAAQDIAERLGSGLWRHRACFGLGEALFFEAKFPEAAIAFAKAASIAAEAEPPVEGFANSLCALAWARSGRLEQACALIMGPRGHCLTAHDGLLLQRFASLGIAAEILLRSGREAEAMSVAEQAFALCERDPRADVFFAGLHGYAGILFTFLHALASNPARTDVATRKLEKRLGVTLRRVRSFARMYPAAGPCVQLLAARHELALGKLRRATASFQCSLELSLKLEQPYFEFLANCWLAHGAVSEQRDSRLAQADILARRFTLVFDQDLGG